MPRAIETLFREAVDCNHSFLFTFSMLEIYMGNLKDLLITQPRKAMDPMPPWWDACIKYRTVVEDVPYIFYGKKKILFSRILEETIAIYCLHTCKYDSQVLETKLGLSLSPNVMSRLMNNYTHGPAKFLILICVKGSAYGDTFIHSMQPLNQNRS